MTISTTIGESTTMMKLPQAESAIDHVILRGLRRTHLIKAEKPRLALGRTLWICAGRGLIGMGVTPTQAWDEWLEVLRDNPL